MAKISVLAVLSALTASTRAGTTVWTGDFSPYTNVSYFDIWSPSDPVGEYQWYIHGESATTHYLTVGAEFKNPADTAETQGMKYTLDSTAVWNDDAGLERTELIPNPPANLGVGELFYHFSLGFPETNLPNTAYEHQMFYFTSGYTETSGFTELTIGTDPNPTELQWLVDSEYQWSTPIVPGGWNNFAYDINFDEGSIALYFSTGSDPLVKVAGPVSVDAESNSEDWHVGFLRQSIGNDTENYYVSGVYIEQGPLTTDVSGAGTSVGQGNGGDTGLNSGTTVPTSGTTPATALTTSTGAANYVEAATTALPITTAV